VAGRDVDARSPAEAAHAGLVMLPEDRRRDGLVLPSSIRRNVSLTALGLSLTRWGFVRRAARARLVRQQVERLRITPSDPERTVATLSGGNQQKVLLARSLTRTVKLFAFDEPTVGVDVGTRVAIYAFIRDLCEAGAAILLISSDLPEILHLTHRAYVMHRGRLRAELSGSAINQETVLGHFFEREAA
jgi:ribose transport system ATP-binding protein